MNPLSDQLTRAKVQIPELTEIYLRWGANPALATWAISSLEIMEPSQVWRALWLLRQIAQTRELSEQELSALAEKGDIVEHWTARLNLCQLLAATGVPASVRDELFPFLRESFSDRRQIIRAWAISALVTFQADKRFRPEIEKMLRQAHREAGKAMQARLRRLKRSGRKQDSATRHMGRVRPI